MNNWLKRQFRKFITTCIIFYLIIDVLIYKINIKLKGIK